MRLEYTNPVAGKSFRITAREFDGLVRIQIGIDGTLLSKKEFRRDPSHEMVALSTLEAGKILQISATVGTGTSHQIALEIHPNDGSSDASMLNYVDLPGFPPTAAVQH